MKYVHVKYNTGTELYANMGLALSRAAELQMLGYRVTVEMDNEQYWTEEEAGYAALDARDEHDGEEL